MQPFHHVGSNPWTLKLHTHLNIVPYTSTIQSYDSKLRFQTIPESNVARTITITNSTYILSLRITSCRNYTDDNRRFRRGVDR